MKKAAYIMMIVICCLYGLSALLDLIFLVPVATQDAVGALVAIIAFILILVPIAWVGPMTAAARKHIGEEKPAVALGVCTIIFIAVFAFLSLISANVSVIIFTIVIFVLGLISGIFLLLNKA